jgi:hypothetical protein
MAVGLFNFNTQPQDYAKKSFASMITRIMPGGSAPLMEISSMLKEETALQVEHGFYTKTMLFPSVALASAASATDNILNVVTTDNILPNMILRSDTTMENMLILGIVSPTQISVQRSVGTVPAQSIANGASLWMAGNAFEEASNRPPALIIVPKRVTNLTQIFRNTWALSNTARATVTIAGDGNVAENMRDASAFHAVDMEKALIFGQRYEGSLKGQPLRLMDGIISFITNNAPGNITTAGATMSYAQLIAALDPGFNQVTSLTGNPMRMLFCGGTAKNALHQIFRLNSTYFIEGASGMFAWGRQYDEFKIPRGYFRIIEHSLFNAFGPNSSFAEMCITLDLSTFCLAPMIGRRTSHSNFNMSGMEVDNGFDGVGGTITTELTCEIKNPAADAIIYNLTAGAVGQ